MLEPIGQGGNKSSQVRVLQSPPYLEIIMHGYIYCKHAKPQCQSGSRMDQGSTALSQKIGLDPEGIITLYH